LGRSATKIIYSIQQQQPLSAATTIVAAATMVVRTRQNVNVTRTMPTLVLTVVCPVKPCTMPNDCAFNHGYKQQTFTCL
jgi:hypothetical protein